MTREKAFELAMQACKETWNEKTCAEIIKALEQEPYEDAISRQAVMDALCDGCELFKNGEQTCRLKCEEYHFLATLPPVTPQPKTGHWIQTNEFFINQDGQFIYKFICSECKSLSYFRKSNKKAIGANVCPNCGCRMVEPLERNKQNG